MKADSGRLRVPGNLESIARIRHWLDALLHRWQVPHDAVSDILSAVTEVCTNVVRHGYRSPDAGEIELEAVYQSDTIEITITDNATTFVPDPGANLPASRLAEGGYGTFLIHSLMDQVKYEPLGATGNRTTLVKRVGTSTEDRQHFEEQAGD